MAHVDLLSQALEQALCVWAGIAVVLLATNCSDELIAVMVICKICKGFFHEGAQVELLF